MITGASHALSQDLMMSMQNFRVQLEQQRNVKANEVSETGAPTATESSGKIETPQKPDETKIDYEALKSDIDNRKGSARQAAVHVAGLKHQQSMVDTYINVSSDNEQSSSTSMGIEPADVYQKSMDYSRNMALIEAFESVGSEDVDRVHVSVLV